MLIRNLILIAKYKENGCYCKVIVVEKYKSVDCDCCVRRWMETNGCLLALAADARNTLDTSLDWTPLLWKYDWQR